MLKTIDRVKSLLDGQTVSAFAKSIGLKQRIVDMYLKNERKPSLEFIKNICANYGVSADWLLGLSTVRVRGAMPASASARAVADSRAPSAESASHIQELEAEVARLNGEVAGLRYALNAISSAPSSKEKRKGVA